MNRRSLRARRGGTRQIVLLAVLLVLAVAVGWMWFQSPTQPNVDEGRAVAEKFLEQIRGGQAKDAWESTTAEFKSAEGRETFVKYVKAHPRLAKPLTFVSVQTVTVQDSPRAECIYRAEDGSGNVHLLVGNERGTWRIDRIKAD